MTKHHIKRIIDVSGSNYRFIKDGKQAISPLDFVGYVKQAECVFTISFHGTALSIILEKPFYAILLNDGRDGRVENLLEICGLRDRIITFPSHCLPNTVIDYYSVKANISPYVKYSKDYIFKCIK